MKFFIKKLSYRSLFAIRYPLRASSGFTLLEAMIAVGIFTVIMIVGISALLNVNSTYKKTHNFRSIIDSVNYMMEDMARNMRLGSNYYCYGAFDNPYSLVSSQQTGTQNCTPSSWNGLEVAIEKQGGIPTNFNNDGADHLEDQIVYWIDQKPTDATVCELKKSTQGGQPGTFISVTPAEILLSCVESGFNVYGTNSPTENSPRILIRLSGVVRYKNTTTPFNIQTTAQQRTLILQ